LRNADTEKCATARLYVDMMVRSILIIQKIRIKSMVYETNLLTYSLQHADLSGRVCFNINPDKVTRNID